MAKLHTFHKEEHVNHRDLNELSATAERGDTLSVGQGLIHSRTANGHHIDLARIQSVLGTPPFTAVITREPEEGDRTLGIREVDWQLRPAGGDGQTQIRNGEYRFRGPEREAVPTFGFLPEDYADLVWQTSPEGRPTTDDTFVSVRFNGLFFEVGAPPTMVENGGVKLEIMGYGRVEAGEATNARATFLDHIICRLRDPADGVWSETMVAKPRHLQARNARRTRLLDRPNEPATIRLEYEGLGLPDVSLDRRVARNTATLEDEDQIITPSYAIGETITVGRVGVAITGVTVVDEGFEDERAGFIDVNGDGSPVPLDLMDMGMYRNWCHPPTTTPRPQL